MTPDTSAAKAGKTSRGLLSFLGSIIASSVFAAVMVGGIVLLHSHASGDLQPEPADPIVVATSTIETVSGYEHTRSYVGRLEPARQTAVAFERSGLVSQVIADEGDRIKDGRQGSGNFPEHGALCRADTYPVPESEKRIGVKA